MSELITMLIPIIAGSLATVGFAKLKELLVIIGGLHATIQQVIVAVTSWGLTKASALLAVTISTTDLSLLSQTDLLGLISAALAFVFHLGKQNSVLKTQLTAQAK